MVRIAVASRARPSEWSRTLDQIRNQVKALGPRRFVVVTDRYPPDSHGGAELSLHTVLREMVTE